MQLRFLAFNIFFISSTLWAETIYPSSLKVSKGSVSDQGLGTLTVQDQSSNDNDWEKYIEVSANRNRSIVKYFFDIPQEAQSCSSATIRMNEMGEPSINEKWKFYIRNFSSKKFEFLSQNGKQDWSWEEQIAFVNNLPDYINGKGKLQLKVQCKKSCSVRDIDYMAVSFEGCGTDNNESSDEQNISLDSSYNVQYVDADNLVTDGFDVVDIDMEDSSAELISSLKEQGKTVVCYISAGSYEDWRSDEASFNTSVLGSNMSGWPGEKWLDISNTEVLEPIMAVRMDRAKAKGCDAIHPDNIDGYSNNTGFNLSYNEQLVYNRLLANLAHERGLIIGLKNDVEQIDDLVDYFDFVINESCYVYNECGGYSAFIEAKKPVFIIEYDENVFENNLQDAISNQFYMIHKHWDLDSYVRTP